MSSISRSDVKTVIPMGAIITLGNLGTILHKSSRVYLSQQALCFSYYQTHDAATIAPDYDIEELCCKIPIIQSRLIFVDGVDSFLQCLPRKPARSVFKSLSFMHLVRTNMSLPRI